MVTLAHCGRKRVPTAVTFLAEIHGTYDYRKGYTPPASLLLSLSLSLALQTLPRFSIHGSSVTTGAESCQGRHTSSAALRPTTSADLKRHRSPVLCLLSTHRDNSEEDPLRATIPSLIVDASCGLHPCGVHQTAAIAGTDVIGKLTGKDREVGEDLTHARSAEALMPSMLLVFRLCVQLAWAGQVLAEDKADYPNPSPRDMRQIRRSPVPKGTVRFSMLQYTATYIQTKHSLPYTTKSLRRSTLLRHLACRRSCARNRLQSSVTEHDTLLHLECPCSML